MEISLSSAVSIGVGIYTSSSLQNLHLLKRRRVKKSLGPRLDVELECHNNIYYYILLSTLMVIATIIIITFKHFVVA